LCIAWLAFFSTLIGACCTTKSRAGFSTRTVIVIETGAGFGTILEWIAFFACGACVVGAAIEANSRVDVLLDLDTQESCFAKVVIVARFAEFFGAFGLFGWACAKVVLATIAVAAFSVILADASRLPIAEAIALFST
jgi:hypothetical protein